MLLPLDRLWGEPVNLREQHDALEFFNNLLDNLDEGLKALSSKPLFSDILGGSFADQKICKGCPHRYEYPFYCYVTGEDNNVVFPLISPIRNFGNERGTEAKMRPATVSGIVTGNALSLVTAREVFAKVSSIQFSSRSQVTNWDFVFHYF